MPLKIGENANRLENLLASMPVRLDSWDSQYCQRVEDKYYYQLRTQTLPQTERERERESNLLTIAFQFPR